MQKVHTSPFYNTRLMCSFDSYKMKNDTHKPICNFLTKCKPYFNIKGPFFEEQSVRKFGSAVFSWSKFWYNYFAREEWILCMFFTCKERISRTYNVTSGYKLPLSSQGWFCGFQDGESEIEPKTNSRFQVCPLFTCKEHAPSSPFARTQHIQELSQK